jgi:hypothetical protein
MSAEVDNDLSKSFAFLVTRKRDLGLGVIATIGVFGIVFLMGAQAAWTGSGQSLVGTAQLQPVPTDVFEHATGLHIEPPRTFNRTCSLEGSRPLVRRLQGLAKAECPLPVADVVMYAAQPRILGANLISRPFTTRIPERRC